PGAWRPEPVDCRRSLPSLSSAGYDGAVALLPEVAMTEAEWLECTEPQKMLGFLRGKVRERMLRLFAAACCRQLVPVLAARPSCVARGSRAPTAAGRIRRRPGTSTRSVRPPGRLTVPKSMTTTTGRRPRRGLTAGPTGAARQAGEPPWLPSMRLTRPSVLPPW